MNSFLGTCLVVCFFAFTLTAFAADYVPLTTLPGVSPGTAVTSIPDFLNRIYISIIGLGAMFGVVKIAIAGFKWAFSDIITDKAAAKKDIQGVLLGLAILFIPFLVLYTINPKLVELDVLKSLKNAPSIGSGSGSGSSPTTGTNPGGSQPPFGSQPPGTSLPVVP